MLTLALVLVCIVGIDAAITRTPILWHHASFENTRDMTRVVFGHTYRAARHIYGPKPDAGVHVALLGNSRIWLPAQEAYVQRALADIAPEMDARVHNLGIFGARIGDLEVLSRHLATLDPTLVVLAISGWDLVSTPLIGLENLPSRLLRVGWHSGPLPQTVTERLDQWLRTLWPLYRFREFTAAAIADRFVPETGIAPFPDRFPDSRTVFEHVDAETADEVERAYRAWRSAPTFAGYLEYLNVSSPGHLDVVQHRVSTGSRVDENGAALRVLDVLLARLARGPAKAVVLLLPENPVLDDDAEGEYHRTGFSDATAALVGVVARRHGVPLIDGRRWMPAEAFLDLNHLMPDLSGFQRPLAEMMVRELAEP